MGDLDGPAQPVEGADGLGRDAAGHTVESEGTMMSDCRLDSVSPKLAELFRQAPTTKRRKAAALACEMATSSVGLRDNKEVLRALEALRSETPAAAPLREQIEKLVSAFDDQYLELEEEGQEARKPEALGFFSKARAASAVMFALSHDTGQLHEAIYEAIAAFDDPAEIMRSVEAVLE